MDRRSNSILLLPLLAALALFYPLATRQGSLEPVQMLGSEAAGNVHPRAGGKAAQEWQRGRIAIQGFFGRYRSQIPTVTAHDPRKRATLNFLIMTVPDPVDSGLPHVFDRYMASLQAAVQTQPYFLSSFELPWKDCLLKKGEKDSKDGASGEPGNQNENSDEDKTQQQACKERRFAKEPGFLLLSNPTQRDRIDLLLVYLIGETPTNGIQKQALKSALREVARYCRWWKEGEDQLHFSDDAWPHSPTCEENGQIRILGPSYSGSAQSLDLVLSSWIEDIYPVKPNVKIVSGSATAIDIERDFHNTIQQVSDTGQPNQSKPRFTFSSMELPDSVSIPKFLVYLRGIQRCGSRVKVALLVEGGTVYGNQAKDEQKAGSGEGINDGVCDVHIEQTALPYPLHISQLRAVSEKLRQTQQETSTRPPVSSGTLPLAESLEDAGTRRDISTFSPADAVTAEQVMGNLLSTISREGYHYVGILATDVRDTMFLAQEVHEHVPATILFAFNPDLLYLHPEINQSLRGMLIISSYPLTTANQLWSLPSHPDLRRQFADDTAEGLYNAALALLDADDRVLEYSAPFVDPHKVSEAVTPPVWITVVGRDRLLPVSAFDVAAERAVRDYTYQLPRERAGSPQQSTWFRSFYPEATLIFVIAFGVLCIFFCLPLLNRRHRYAAHPPSTPVSGLRGATTRGSHWLYQTYFDRALGETVAEEHRHAGELYLLTACASLGTFLAVLVSALVIPVTVLKKLTIPGTVSEGTRPFGLALIVISGSVILLLLGTVSLLRALGKKPAGRRATDEPKRLKVLTWVPIAAGSLASVSLALALSRQWINQVGIDFRAALFTSLRSLDLLSGVSPLVPLFLISVAGFLWGVSSFRRMRQLDRLENRSGFLNFGQFGLGEVQDLETEIRRRLSTGSLHLPGAWVIFCLALVSNVYVWWHVLRSLELSSFYWLVPVSYFLVSLALWYSMLRFWCLWNTTQHLLRHLSLVPLPTACKRFRKVFPELPKIDLASRPAELAHLECSLIQARTLRLQARRSISLAGIPLKVVGSGITSHTWQNSALQHLGCADAALHVQNADTYLVLARKADADGRWRDGITSQWESLEALSSVVADTATALQNSWWTVIQESEQHETTEHPGPAEKVFPLGEEFLAGRVAHFLACIFPQMQNLIFTALTGLLLLLFAVSCYPFQPRNMLLLFNWVVILVVVGLAMWVFVHMNRDPVLSNLNGTKAGKISWDWDFIFRIFTYGVVPVLALLGAQFPDSVGQVLSHVLPSDAIHR